MIHSYVESLKAKWVVHNALLPHKMCLKKLTERIDISLSRNLNSLPIPTYSNK